MRRNSAGTEIEQARPCGTPNRAVKGYEIACAAAVCVWLNARPARRLDSASVVLAS